MPLQKSSTCAGQLATVVRSFVASVRVSLFRLFIIDSNSNVPTVFYFNTIDSMSMAVTHLYHWYRDQYMRQFGERVCNTLTGRDIEAIQAILDDSSDDEDYVF